MKELSVEAVIDNLDIVMDFANAELEAYECNRNAKIQISIAIEEIFVNIANYAYQPKVGGVTIRMTVGNEIIIEFEDNGFAYNPIEKPDPDITQSAEEREIGGLGILMVKKIMDSVEYQHIDNKNILTIRKGIS